MVVYEEITATMLKKLSIPTDHSAYQRLHTYLTSLYKANHESIENETELHEKHKKELSALQSELIETKEKYLNVLRELEELKDG